MTIHHSVQTPTKSSLVVQNLISDAVGALGRTASGAVERMAQRHAQRIDRLAFETWLRVDGRVLEDLGVSRADVQRLAALPLDVNAAAELRRMARKKGR